MHMGAITKQTSTSGIPEHTRSVLNHSAALSWTCDVMATGSRPISTQSWCAHEGDVCSYVGSILSIFLPLSEGVNRMLGPELRLRERSDVIH